MALTHKTRDCIEAYCVTFLLCNGYHCLEEFYIELVKASDILFQSNLL